MVFRLLSAQWLAVAYVGVVSFLLSLFIARTVGPDSFGVFVAALSGGAIASILIDGGFGRLLQRERAKETPELVHHSARLPDLALGHALLTTALLCAIAYAVYPKHAMTTIATLCCFAAGVMNQFSLSIKRGEGRLMREAIWQIGNRSASALCIVSVLLLGATQPWQIFWAWSVGAVLFCAVVTLRLNLRPVFRIPSELYKAAVPLMWIDLATAAYFRSDIILFQLFDIPKYLVGQYGAAYRVIDAVIMFAAPVGLILFRRFRRGSPTDLAQPILISVFSAFAIGSGLMLFLHFFGHDLIIFAFGDDFFGAGDMIIVLAYALMFILPNGVLIQVAIALGLDRWCAVSASLAAVFNVTCNMILIPEYGPIAAAWVTVATEVVLGSMIVFAVLKHFGGPVFSRENSVSR